MDDDTERCFLAILRSAQVEGVVTWWQVTVVSIVLRAWFPPAFVKAFEPELVNRLSWVGIVETGIVKLQGVLAVS